jgi:hypothetical protein
MNARDRPVELSKKKLLDPMAKLPLENILQRKRGPLFFTLLIHDS